MTINEIMDGYKRQFPEGAFFDPEMLKRYGESIERMRVTGKGVVNTRGFGDVIAWEVIAQRETILGLEEARYYFDAETFELIKSA